MASPYDPKYNSIRAKIEYYADQWGIPRNIAVAQLWQENKFKSSGCSGAGACGIAQFIPATATRFGVDRSDIDSSLDGWGEYMSWLLRQPYIHGDISLALAGYNAGEGNVQKYHGIPPFSETRNYVSSILNLAGSYVPSAQQIIDTGTGDLQGIIDDVTYADYADENATADVAFTASDKGNYLVYGLVGIAFLFALKR